jgi:hypothetical protein
MEKKKAVPLKFQFQTGANKPERELHSMCFFTNSNHQRFFIFMLKFRLSDGYIYIESLLKPEVVDFLV